MLDADHEGLRDVKDRILEYLAVRKLRAERGLTETGGRGSGAILTLVGPPGVGKTSLGESVARALGRKFVRVSLGGVHDESEIRGHRRTYVGALPGRIVRALKDAGTKNPVMMLDEVDKVGADWRGDPSSALLEVLDPAQNHTFRDHYLDVDLDLSEVLFIATANVAETITGPLLDRMEVIRIDGYTEDEKVAIAKRHLLPRQVERNGLRPEEVEVADDALRGVVGDYTREAGVRNLERELGKIMRKVATKLTSGEAAQPVVVDATELRAYLGRQKFFFEAAERTAVPGVSTGLAVTGTGGDVLFIEATREDVPEDGLTLTGQLGDVMKESARIALSYVRSHAAELDIPAERLRGRFHVHVPAGAVPKDGPSAGVAMTTALASLLTGRPVRAEVGMTGEVTLQGRVLPIGGVKQKVLAAHRAGLKEVILPSRNEGDLDDVPEQVREEMTFHLAEEAGRRAGDRAGAGRRPTVRAVSQRRVGRGKSAGSRPGRIRSLSWTGASRSPADRSSTPVRRRRRVGRGELRRRRGLHGRVSSVRTAPGRRPRCGSRWGCSRPTAARFVGEVDVVDAHSSSPVRLHPRGARPLSEDARPRAARVSRAATRRQPCGRAAPWDGDPRDPRRGDPVLGPGREPLAREPAARAARGGTGARARRPRPRRAVLRTRSGRYRRPDRDLGARTEDARCADRVLQPPARARGTSVRPGRDDRRRPHRDAGRDRRAARIQGAPARPRGGHRRAGGVVRLHPGRSSSRARSPGE